MSLFVAWMPDEDAQTGLLALRGEAEASLPASRGFGWRPRNKLHMTLRYLGHVVDAVPAGFAAELADVAARSERIAVRFDRVETWPGANALVARTAASVALDSLLDRIDAAAQAAGYVAHAGHQTPHVTLAYAHYRPAASTIALADALACVIGHLSIVETASDGYRTLDWWALQDRVAGGDPDAGP